VAAGPPRSLLVALSLAGAGAVLLAASPYGAGLSPDAVGYVGVARQLLAGQGVSGYEGAPFVIQPPLYPVLLALAGWVVGVDPLRTAPTLNALLCGAVILLSIRLAAQCRAAFPGLAGFGPALALLSWPLFAVGVMAWSEPLFITCHLAALLCLCHYLERGGWGWLAGAALGVGLACLTRYIGMAFLAAGGMLVLWRGIGPWRERLGHLAGYGGLAGLPLALWLWRNYQVAGSWLGPRQPSAHTLPENLGLAAAGLAGLWVPEVLVPARLVLLALGAVGGLVLVASLARLAPDDRAILAPVAVWAGAYGAFLVATSTTTAYDDINLRLLSPLHPLLAVLLLAGAGQLAGRGWPRLTRAGLAALLLCSLGGIGAALARYAAEGAGAGTGADRYNTAPWRHSEVLDHLRRHPVEGPLYSNAPEALYILCGQRAALAPRRQEGGEWPALGWLVWLDPVRRRYLLDPAEVPEGLRLAARFADGALYEFKSEDKE